MNSNNLFSRLLIAVSLSFSGCQSWQGAAFPLPNATRVPPPGTGTYQLPSGYYNNNSTSSLPVGSPATQLAGTSSGLTPGSGMYPTTNMPATNLVQPHFATSPVASPNFQATGSNVAATGGVSTASFTASPDANNYSAVVAARSQPVESTDFSSQIADTPQTWSTQSPPNYSNSGTSANLSDSIRTEVPSLQWQQFDGQ